MSNHHGCLKAEPDCRNCIQLSLFSTLMSNILYTDKQSDTETVSTTIRSLQLYKVNIAQKRHKKMINGSKPFGKKSITYPVSSLSNRKNDIPTHSCLKRAIEHAKALCASPPCFLLVAILSENSTHSSGELTPLKTSQKTAVWPVLSIKCLW